MHNTRESKEKLVADMKTVVNDIDDLIRAAAGAANGELSGVKHKLHERIETARQSLNGLDEQVVERAKSAARATDGYIKANPWAAIGVAVLVGAAIGVVIASATTERD